MRQFKLFNSDRLPVPVYPEPNIYAIVFQDLVGDIKVPAVPGYDPNALAVTL
jgi:hypothetical protein